MAKFKKGMIVKLNNIYYVVINVDEFGYVLQNKYKNIFLIHYDYTLLGWKIISDLFCEEEAQ